MGIEEAIDAKVQQRLSPLEKRIAQLEEQAKSNLKVVVEEKPIRWLRTRDIKSLYYPDKSTETIRNWIEQWISEETLKPKFYRLGGKGKKKYYEVSTEFLDRMGR